MGDMYSAERFPRQGGEGAVPMGHMRLCVYDVHELVSSQVQAYRCKLTG